MRMLRFTLIACLVCVAPALAFAQTRPPTDRRAADVRIEVIAAGTFTARSVGSKANATDPTGREDTVDDVVLREATDRVCARLGVAFGIDYRLTGAGSEPVTLRIVTRFPEAGIVNASGTRFALTESTSELASGENTVRLYAFDERWEMVAGVWSFEIYLRDRKLAEQKFIVMTDCGTS